MSSDGNGSSDGRSSKLMGVLEKLGTSGEVRVSACPCIYIYICIFLHLVCIVYIYVPTTYAMYSWRIHMVQRRLQSNQVSPKARVNYDYSLKGDLLKVLWFFSMFSEWEDTFGVNMRIFF